MKDGHDDRDEIDTFRLNSWLPREDTWDGMNERTDLYLDRSVTVQIPTPSATLSSVVVIDSAPVSRLEAAARRGEFLVTAEVTPPKGSDPTHMLEQVKGMIGRVHAVNVTDSNRAISRMSPLAASYLLLQAGIEPVFQLACRDRNRLALQGDLMGASALGLHNVLALTGDPVKVGDCPDAKPVFELESVRLLTLIKRLNQGSDCNDKPLPDRATRFFPGAALEPQSRSVSGLKRRFERKLEAGAQFFQTQMITDLTAMEGFMDTLGRDCGKPILAGILLIKSAKNANFLNKNLPGVNIPEEIINRFAQAGSKEEQLQVGIQIAAEQIQRCRQICQGVHLMAVKAEHLIPRILDEAGISSVEA